jgi:hypothetical protein
MPNSSELADKLFGQKVIDIVIDEQLNGVCQDPSHEICFLRRDFEQNWISKRRVKEAIHKILYDDFCDDDENEEHRLLKELGLEAKK